jgi:hypothetical protein
MLRREYEDLTSREAIEDFLDCNEFQFLEDSTVYHPTGDIVETEEN